MAVNKVKSKLGFKVTLRFMIGLSGREILLLKDIIAYLGCGTLYINTKANKVQYTVTVFSDILKIIIPLVNNCPMVGVKALDFKDWCKVADLMENRRHLTEDGIVEIQQIKAGMNSQRIPAEDPVE